MLKEKTKILRIPKHVAVIMDGNRRWAKERALEAIEGHKLGVERIKELVQSAAEKGVKSITFWAFSTENWTRDKNFLKDIFRLFRHVLNERRDFFNDLVESGGQIHILGDVSKFPRDIVDKINDYLREPGPKEKLIDVNIALNYGGRDELVRVIKKIVDEGHTADEITVDLINQYLDTAGQPDVDLMIRTGGEIRTSGFLLWQLTYAELYFTKTFFPDFGKEELEKALEDYSVRNRRFGGDTHIDFAGSKVSEGI